MAKIVSFYNFNKRLNSTKRLPSSVPVVVASEFVYKDSVDINNPKLLINMDIGNSNYAAIDDMHFFVESVTTVHNDLWEVQLRNDVLSNHRDDILATGAFVAYSDNRYDSALIDNRVKATCEYARQSNSEVMAEFGNGGTGGMYFLTCVGNPYKNSGGWSATYAFSKDGLIQLLNKFYSDDAWTQLQKFFANPDAAIVECYWLPFQAEQITSVELTTLEIGKWNSGLASILLSNIANQTVQTTTLTIPWQSNDFRRHKPYSSLEVFIPCIGLVELDPETFYSYDTMTIQRVTDPSTGKMQCNIYGGSSPAGSPQVTLSGDVKVTIPIGQVQSRVPSFLGAVNGALQSAAVGGLSGGAIGAIGAGGVSLLNGMISAARYTVAHNGGYSGSTCVASLRPHNIYCTVTAHSVRPEPSSFIGKQGRPCMQNLTLSGCSGYTQTIGASVSSSTTHSDEIQQINGMLDSGIFIE